MSRGRKRENGSGSVFKRKDKVYRPWVAKVSIKNGDTKRQITLGNFSTSKQAYLALDEFLEAPTDQYNCTFSQVFYQWKAVAYRNISKSLKDNYESAYKKLTPLYDMKFREIKTAALQKIIDENAELSKSSLSKIRTLLTQLFDYGMMNDIVRKNYASYIVLPKKEIKEKEAFTDIEIAKIENAVGKVDHADAILFLIYTGFRISEFLELKPSNYNPDTKCLCGGKKTNAGKNRIVPVHPKIQPIVDQWLEKGGETIFCKPDGKPYTADNFRKDYYYKALLEIGVRRLTPHATRHTFATMLARQNVRPENIQKLMGHTNYGFTASVYVHQDSDTLRNCIEKLA